MCCRVRLVSFAERTPWVGWGSLQARRSGQNGARVAGGRFGSAVGVCRPIERSCRHQAGACRDRDAITWQPVIAIGVCACRHRAIEWSYKAAEVPRFRPECSVQQLLLPNGAKRKRSSRSYRRPTYDCDRNGFSPPAKPTCLQPRHNRVGAQLHEGTEPAAWAVRHDTDHERVQP